MWKKIFVAGFVTAEVPDSYIAGAAAASGVGWPDNVLASLLELEGVVPVQSASMHICLGTTPTVQQTMSFARVTPDEVNRAVETRRGASGKPINVARVLNSLGEKTMLCIPVGGDTGRFIRADLDALGIAHDCVESKAPTRTCVTVIDRSTRTATELVEESGPLSADESAQMLATFQKHLPGCRMAVFSGTLAQGVSEDFYAECCRAAGKFGVPVIIDARGNALTRALASRPLVVKPNRHELAGMVGKAIDDDASLRGAMIGLHRQGAQWVIITMGRAGAVACDGTSFWKIPAIKIEAVSAIGSGDAFAAGLASAITAGRDVLQACRLAVACAAANALVVGAGILRVEDVRRLEPMAVVERWD
jgi:1-phosphofructokinase family hexose kinase